MADTTHGEVHLGQTECVGVLLLTIHVYGFGVAAMSLNKLYRLHEHTARTAARVIDGAVVRLND